jgi:UDP-glucose 4-epimerase
MAIPHISAVAGKRILITGVSGFLGFHLAEHFIREGAIVGGLSRTKGRMHQTVGSGNFVFLPCDLEDSTDSIGKIRDFNPQILFHFAAQPDCREGIQQCHATIKGNILATVNALEGFRHCGGELFVYGDSCKVYGEAGVPYEENLPVKPLSSYAIAKAAGWEYCKLYDRLYSLASVSVRPTLVYGPGQGFNVITYVIDAVLEGQQTLNLDGGTQTRDPLYIQDAVRAFEAIAQKGRTLKGRIINISGGCEIAVSDLAQFVVTLMGSSMRVLTDFTQMRLTETMRSYCKNIEAFEALGWKPHVSLSEGLTNTVEYLSAMRTRKYQYLVKRAAAIKRFEILHANRLNKVPLSLIPRIASISTDHPTGTEESVSLQEMGTA